MNEVDNDLFKFIEFCIEEPIIVMSREDAMEEALCDMFTCPKAFNPEFQGQ
jgi:hypothetical protein